MSAPTFSLDALRVACGKGDALRDWLNNPMAVTIDGAAWTVATNGHRLLAVRHDYGAGRAPEAILKGLLGFHRDAFAPGAIVMPLAPLRAFFADHEPPPEGECPACLGKPDEECEECDGDGEVDCECIGCGHVHQTKCRTCNGTGGWKCPRCAQPASKVLVKVGVAVFDARAMGPIFRVMPDGEALVHQQDTERMTTLAGADWFALIMPCRADSLRGVPVFHLPSGEVRRHA